MSTSSAKNLMRENVLTFQLKAQNRLTTEIFVLEKINKNLRSQLPSVTFDRWQVTTKEVCAKAYAPYKQGSIYLQMIIRCDDSLNLALRQALKGLEEN
ncbi:chorismate-binding protein [Prochlorococcus marinus]|nr:chorismate-binding protein [Prochlorococcus marinus]